MITEKIRLLENIDWEFSDYRGFSSFPADINSLHWYPAPFIPQIPGILIHTLTSEEEIVFDPFAGAGVAMIEAARLRRSFIGIDINPYAVNIMKAKLRALSVAGKEWYQTIENEVQSYSRIGLPTRDYCRKRQMSDEVFKWFEKETLAKLCALHQYVSSEQNQKDKLLKRVLFSSILNSCCSQKEHYTYITDGCYPDKLMAVDVIKLFLGQTRLVALAADTFRKQYEITYGERWKQLMGVVTICDARDVAFVRDESIDMVITSPPYLAVNDYVKSMRLTKLFFPERGTTEALEKEIGARRKRGRKNAYGDYIKDMDKSFSEMARVLKKAGFLCFTIGQGRGKVNKGDVVYTLLKILQHKYGFGVLARFDRKIKFRRIQVPGVGKEEIIILKRNLK